MKKLIYSLAFLFILHNFVFINTCSCQWEPTNGPFAGSVYSLAFSGNNIFAGTGNNVYLSTINGNNWIQTALYNQRINSLAAFGNNIFAGTDSGVYYSANNGSSWTHTSLNNQEIYSLAVSGINIYAGTGGFGVYYSANNGNTWVQTTLNNQSVHSLAIDGNNIFAGTGNGVFLTTNNGNNWTQTALNNVTVYSFAISGFNIFAGTANFSGLGGVYISSNNGVSWSITSLHNGTVNALAAEGTNLFAGTFSTGVFLSTNNGLSWINKNQGLGTGIVFALLITNSYIFASGIDDEVWRRLYSEIIGIQNISGEIPSGFQLHQNYPNPFNPTTNIRYNLPKNGFVKLVVFDITGKEIETLVNEKQSVGTYEAKFDGSQLSSGVYFYKMQAGDFIQTKKMFLLK